MLTNEVQLVSTEITPTDLCVQTTTNQVDLDVDTAITVTGFKREYAIVGDAYFASVTAGDTPDWIVNIINDIVNNTLSTVLVDVSTLKTSVLESLRELEVAKNQYEELINIEATIDSIISSRLATLNASLANTNAQIIELDTTKVTAQQAVAISINQISSELNSPTGTLYGAITDIRTTVTHLNGELDARYAELYGITDGMGYSLSVEIERVEASIETVAETVTEAIIESMDLALATDVLAVANSVTTLTAAVDADRSYVNSGFSTVTSALSAQAAATTTLRADMNTEFALVESDMTAFATSLGGIGARYGVKLTAGGVNPAGSATSLVGGFELLNDGTLVSAGFDVDEFWVGRTSVTGKKPFRIASDIVYIDNAVIENGTITTAKIQDAAITNAKIGNVIQSDDYVPTVSGWTINKSANYAEFGNVYARGNIKASSLEAGVAMVDTLNVNGGAVTTMYRAVGGGGTCPADGTTGDTTYLTIGDMPSGSTGVTVIIFWAAAGNSGNANTTGMLYKNGSHFGEFTYSARDGWYNACVGSFFDPSPIGSPTYTIRFKNEGNGGGSVGRNSFDYGSPTIMIIGGKR